MSKKNKMTPAEVANQLGAFIAKQEETLRKYPVGPMANAARANLKKGRAAIEALKGQNEAMRQQMPGQPKMMVTGGATIPADLSASITAETGLTQGQLDMLNYLKTEAGYSDAVALAAVSVTSKESGGDSLAVERSYRNTSAENIRGINPRFKAAFADMTDAEIDELKQDDEAFFNHVYSDVTGNTEEGDGYKYRGRGLIQITGKANYRDASREVFGDDRLVDDPDQLLDPNIAGKVAGWFASSRGKGIGGYLDFDPSEPNPSPEQLQQVITGSFATIASGGTLSKEKAFDEEFMAKKYPQSVKSIPKMQNFTDTVLPAMTASNAYAQFAQTPALEMPATPEQQSTRTTMSTLPTPEEDKAELDRRMAALDEAEMQETLAMLRANTNNTVPEDAQMRAAGLNRGYLGGTYGQDQTRVQQPIDPAELQAAQAAAEFTRTQKEELGSYGYRVAKDQAAAAAMAQDFPIEDVMAWAEDTYDLVDVETRHGMNVEGFDQRVIQVGQQAMSPQEAAVMMQTLKDNGMLKDEAYEALSSPAVVENILETNRSGNPLTFNNLPDSPGVSITWNDDYNLENLKILGKNMSDNLTNKQSGNLNRRALANLIEQETGVDARTLDPVYEEVGFTPEAMVDWIENSTNFKLTDNEYSPGRTKVNTGVDAGPSVTPESLSYMAQGLVDQGFSEQQALKWLENGSNVRELALAGQRYQMKIDADQVSENQGGRRLLPGELYRRGIREAINDPAWLEENTKSGAFQAAGVNVDALESRPMAPLDSPQPSDRVLRQTGVMRDRAERPNDLRVEPNFIPAGDLPAPNVLDAPDMLPISDRPVQDGVTQVPDVVIPEKPAPEPLPNKDAQVPVNLPRKEIQVSGGPEMVQMNMPNMTPLMGIPAMASLASVGIQRRALEKMRGPQAPILTDIPQFSYQSNLGQQMMDARNATNAAMRADGMSDTARAGMRGNLLAQRFQQEARLRTADNAQRQAAQQRYDQLAYQARATQDALRNKYNEDMVNFSNQKAMLNAQLQQQPLNVLSATTQDYLKNVYAPNLASQMEGLGRQFDTGAYNTSVFDQDAE